MRWDVANMPLNRLKTVIWEAWKATPNDPIENLVNSWWDRYMAVEGDPTKY